MSRIKSGIVMELKNNRACVMTSDGQFLNLRIKSVKPEIGEEYTGEVITTMPNFGKIAAAASLIFVLLTGTAAYAYTIPVASVTLSSPAVRVEVNRWNRIIKAVPLDNDAKDILSSVNITNKPLNDGLNTFVDEVHKKEASHTSSGKDKNNSNDSKKIVVYVDDKKNNSEVNLSKFEEHANNNNLKVEITKKDKDSNNNGKTNKGSSKKSDDQKGNGKNNSDKGNSNNNKGKKK